MQIAALVVSAFLSLQAPTVVTGSAASITTGSAEVQGTVNPGGQPTTYQVEYGTTSAYGIRTPARDAGSGTAPVDVRVTLTGLTANTTYHYRLTANDGAVVGEGRTFRTSAQPSAPSISSRAATAVTGSSAVLNASVNPRSLATTVRFEYGTTTAYGASTAEQPIGAGGVAVPVSAAIAGLRPGTRYNFRAIATSPAGVRRGSNRTFTTPQVPTGVAITPSTIRPTWNSGLTITGTVSGSGRTPVALERLDFPFTGAWIAVATTTSNSSGAFTLNAPPLHATTRLRVATRTVPAVTSTVTTAFVAVKVGIIPRRVSSRRYRFEGTIWPAVAQGRVSLQRQTSSGRWMPVSRTAPTALGGDRSRYRFTITRSRSRTLNYRVVVVPNDGGLHVNGRSRTVTVPRAR